MTSWWSMLVSMCAGVCVYASTRCLAGKRANADANSSGKCGKRVGSNRRSTSTHTPLALSLSLSFVRFSDATLPHEAASSIDGDVVVRDEGKIVSVHIHTRMCACVVLSLLDS